LAGANTLSGTIKSGGQFVRVGLVELSTFSTNYCINGAACANNVPLLFVMSDLGDAGVFFFFNGVMGNTGPGS
jgi:hypothetical protein